MRRSASAATGFTKWSLRETESPRTRHNAEGGGALGSSSVETSETDQNPANCRWHLDDGQATEAGTQSKIARELEDRTQSAVGAANWITARKDQDRFQAPGYELEGPDQDVTLALLLDGRLKPGEILGAFGVPTGTFAHYPSDDF